MILTLELTLTYDPFSTTLSKETCLSSVHGEEAHSRDQDTNDQDDQGRDQTQGSRHTCRHTSARVLVVKDVPGGAVLPP